MTAESGRKLSVWLLPGFFMNEPQPLPLARLLGLPVHQSAVLRKLHSLGIDAPEKLIALAAQRGCHHYQTGLTVPPVPAHLCSNEELAAALLSPNNPYHPRLIRAGAQLLSGSDIRPERLVHEALKERCGEALWHVVRAARRVEPENPTWTRLAELIAGRFKRLKPVRAGILPADGRFCVETGFIGRRPVNRIQRRWLRPTRTAS
jgi:hypothetical protein